MAEFTANVGDATGFAPPNALFDLSKSIQGAQAIQQNQLGQQGAQMQLDMAGADQVGRAAAGLLSAYPDEASRAKAYGPTVGLLQAQGLAKNAPAQYPGEAALKALVSQTIPVEEQYKLGIITPPGLADALAQANRPLPGQLGFTQQLGQSESASPSTINGGGYTGQFQFGKARLQDLGYYTPAPGEDMKDNNTWAGKVTVPGFNVTDQQSFAANSAAQNVVFKAHLANIDQAIAQTPGADRFDANGLRAVAHLGGIGGMQKFVQSGGAYSPADTNGTSLAAYYNKFAGGSGAQPSLVRPTVAAATPGAAGAPATPAPYQVASLAPTAPPTQPPAATPASTTPALPPPSAQPLIQAPLGPQETPAAAAPAPQVAAVQPPAQTQAPTPPPGAVDPAAQPNAKPLPGTGVNSDQFKTALWKTQQAALLEAKYPLSPQAKAAAAELRAEAALYMQADSVITLADGTQVSALTGKRSDAAKPAEHWVKGPDGQWYDTGTGKPLTQPATPRFTEGSAVWDGKQWTQPTPDNLDDAVPGKWGIDNTGKQTFLAEGQTPAQHSYKSMDTAYQRDSKDISGIAADARAAQADQIRVQEMRNILKTVDTGGGSETNAAIRAYLQRWLPQAATDWTRDYANLQGPAALEMFQKLGFMGATSAEQQTTPRGGYQATMLFQKFNPGAQLLTATNQGLLAQRLINNQQTIDYNAGAQNHFADQENAFQSAKPSYKSLDQYDRKWSNQRNPQVYAGAIGALGQQDYEQWSAHLSQDEIQSVLGVVHRADPSATVKGPEGKPLNLNQPLPTQPPAQTRAPAAAAQPTRIIHYGADGKRL